LARQKRCMTDEPKEHSDRSPVSVPASDRRAHPRQRIRSLAYVHLGEGNGGIILNISEGGIGVQAAEALDDGEGVIAMRIEIPRSRKRLEVRGEIVWVGESRKEAGLRFVDLQEDALRRIRAWMAREESPGTAQEESEEEEVEAPVVRAETVAIEEASGRRDEPVAGAEKMAARSEEEICEVEEPAEDYLEPVEFDGESIVIEEEAADGRGDTRRISPAEVAGTAALATEASRRAADKPATAAPLNGKEEDRTQKVAPPVMAFDDKPQIPVAPYTPISGTHGAPAFAETAAPPAPAHYLGGAAASLFPKPHVSVEGAAASAESGWKSFRVQLQSGWFLAALVLLLATISFVAGMAVRRGALNAVMGDVDDVVQPKSAPAPSPVNVAANSSSDGSSPAVSAAPAKPLQIEIVDLENHRWTIPASMGGNRGDAGTARQAQLNEAAPVDAGAPSSAASNVPAPNRYSTQGAASNGAAINGAAGAVTKPGEPEMLSLPEVPISASGSIAIRATSMVPLPAGQAESGQHARNLRIGELVNLVEPVYPADARQARLEGTAKLHVVVGTNGEVESFHPLSGPESLTHAAMIAVREWRYSPTLLNGKPVEMQEDVTFVFRLPN
jgi:TonB family protein